MFDQVLRTDVQGSAPAACSGGSVGCSSLLWMQTCVYCWDLHTHVHTHTPLSLKSAENVCSLLLPLLGPAQWHNLIQVLEAGSAVPCSIDVVEWTKSVCNWKPTAAGSPYRGYRILMGKGEAQSRFCQAVLSDVAPVPHQDTIPAVSPRYLFFFKTVFKCFYSKKTPNKPKNPNPNPLENVCQVYQRRKMVSARCSFICCKEIRCWLHEYFLSLLLFTAYTDS